MRFAAALLILTASLAPAAAQPPASGAVGPVIEALRRDFPIDHQAIAATLLGKPPEEARRRAYAAIDRFLRSHRAAILAAPGPSLVAIEARQGKMLRELAVRDSRLCAAIGALGFFGSEALAAESPPGLAEYGVALIEAAKAGAGSGRSAPLATQEDVAAWRSAVGKVEPRLAAWEILGDRGLRSKSTPDQLCRASAAMHEAVAALPAERAERVARTLLSSVIGSPAL